MSARFSVWSISIVCVGLVAIPGIAGISVTRADDTLSRIEVFPSSVKLHSSRDSARLIVTGIGNDGRLQDLSGEARLEIADDQIVRVVEGQLHPVGDGRAMVEVTAGGQSLEVPVEVAGMSQPARVSFQYDVLAALSKQSCSSGACHGSPTGKGGFRLSLRGFDATLDTLTLVREDLGRRTNVAAPDESLLLQKPLMKVAHGGGQRLRKGETSHTNIRDWIAQGCQPDSISAPVCTGIQVYPKTRELHFPAVSQRLVVLASFSGGRVRDVTDLAVFSSSHDEVAPVDAVGQVVAKDRGEATILARYLDHIDTSSLTFLRDVPGFVRAAPATNNYIDEHVLAKLNKLQIPSANLCTDHEFIRRVYLDVIGLLPSRAEVEAFVTDGSADKRTKLINALLERPDYAEHWAQKWADLLRVKSGRMGTAAMHKFHRWLVAALRENRPYDQICRDLLTAEGSTLQNPPATFYRAAADMNDCAETTAQLFLGIRIQCAKCHNHPFDRWSQDNYYGIGAFFARVGRTPQPGLGDLLVFSQSQGEVTQPRTGKQVVPWLPGVSADKLAAPAIDRRQLLASLLATGENRLFAEVAANRIWGQLMGRGIVEPVDDFRPSNPPANAELLAALTDAFIRGGFNQKELIRTILGSRTYQLSTQANDLNRRDERYFSHAKARLLTAEQLLDGISSVTGVPEVFVGLPAGTRAGQLPSPELGNQFLKVFGQPGRDTACECERGHDPKLTQALQLINGTMIGTKLADRRSRLSQWLGTAIDQRALAGSPPAERLVLWLRADGGVLDGNGSPARDGAPVASWRDASGKIVSQPETSRQPLLVANGPGGLPTLRLDGVDDYLTNNQVNLVDSGKERTLLAVARAAKDGHGGCLFCFRRTTAGGGTVFAAQHVLIGEQYYVYSDGVNGAGNTTLSAERRKSINEPFISAFLSRGQGAKLELAVNGQAQPLSQPGFVGPDAGGAGFTVGSREDIPPEGQAWRGDLSEVLVYDRVLSAEELESAGSYLTTKYAIPSNYPQRKPAASSPEKQIDPREIVADFYYAAFARPPTADELATAGAYIQEAGDLRQGLEDVCWAILNSKEFLFQH